MTDIPAQCERCGTWFSSPNIVSGAGNVTITGSHLGPCPNCGGWGRIPDGTYRLTDSIELIRTAGRDAQQLENLRSLLERAQHDRYEPKRLAETIETQAPAFSGLAALLPQSRSEIQNYLMILLGAISVILAFLAVNPKGQQPPSVTQIFNTIYQQPNAINQQPKATVKNAVTTRRNDPCPCGSGKKFKKCHGATAQ